ncbi:hypothetical protein [Mucisphaera sp.]|uniref:hypothetical protein n=1 Tax=Mucisphaera sp. TaxID=2913024 RepID=UPI003D117628
MKPTTRTTQAALAAALIASPALAGLNLDFEDGTRGPARSAEIFSSLDEFKPRMTVEPDAVLGSGNALFLDSAGGGSEWYIPFDSAVTLGPNEGDKIVVSFDYRTNLDTDPIASPSTDFRFGIFNDNDNSLGQAFGVRPTFDENGEAIRDEFDELVTVPAVFGTDDGHFDLTDGPIAVDFGIHARTSLNLNVPDGDILALIQARVRTEQEGDDDILSGSGTTIAFPGSPPVLSTSSNGITEFANNWHLLKNGSANTITFTIERTMETIDVEAGPEETYRGTLQVDNALGRTVLTGRDPIAELTRETFHYMVFENVSGNFDYVVDNISVMAMSAGGGVTGDFNGDTVVDAADIDLLTAAIRAGSTDSQFDLDGSTAVDAGDLDELIGAILGTVPGDANLDLNVDLIDLSALASNFNAVAGWSQGNFNVDTVVDLIDLSLLATNFGTTGVVPEPAGAALVGLGLAGLFRRR